MKDTVGALHAPVLRFAVYRVAQLRCNGLSVIWQVHVLCACFVSLRIETLSAEIGFGCTCIDAVHLELLPGGEAHALTLHGLS